MKYALRAEKMAASALRAGSTLSPTLLSSTVAIRYEVRCTFVDTDSGAKVQCPLSVFLSANYNQAAVFVQFCSVRDIDCSGGQVSKTYFSMIDHLDSLHLHLTKDQDTLSVVKKYPKHLHFC